MAGSKKKFYVVWKGATPGVYQTWAECKAQIHGFAGAQYKSFESAAAAQAAFAAGPPRSTGVKQVRKSVPIPPVGPAPLNSEGICVDAACSGNPGPMEYQGVSLKDKDQVFHKKFPLGTNNIGEFLAIVHALAYLQKRGQYAVPIYSDSAIAIKWVAGKKCKTTLPSNERTKELLELVHRAESWLEENNFSNPVLKWHTERWGEIPADFGRK
jgi:ribonuclease HI